MLDKKIAIFQGKQIRRHWNENQEKWYFAVVDVVAALTNSSNPQVYWRVLKKRLTDEGSSETVTKCNGLKMLAPDGKMRITETATAEISQKRQPKTFPENKKVAREGGTVAGNARKEIESKTGRKVVTNKNAERLKLLKGK